MPITLPIARLRAIQASLLPATLAVLRYAETSTSDGVSHTWAPYLTGVSCRVDVRSTRGTETAGAEAAAERGYSEWRIWVPALTDVRRTDRVAIDAPDGRTFEVTRVGAKPSSYETVRLLLCTEVS